MASTDCGLFTKGSIFYSNKGQILGLFNRFFKANQNLYILSVSKNYMLVAFAKGLSKNNLPISRQILNKIPNKPF